MNHSGYGQTITWDIDGQPLRIWTDSQSENRQTTILHMDEQPHRKWTDNHLEYGQTTTIQDVADNHLDLDGKPLRI